MAKTTKRRKKGADLILLKDLVPRHDPKGGAGGKTVFGERPFPGRREHPAPTDEKPRGPR